MKRYKKDWIAKKLQENHDYPLTSDLENYSQLCNRTNHEFTKLDRYYDSTCKNITVFGCIFILNFLLSLTFFFTLPLWIVISSLLLSTLWLWVTWGFVKDLIFFDKNN
jgi:hypothetical protein